MNSAANEMPTGPPKIDAGRNAVFCIRGNPDFEDALKIRGMVAINALNEERDGIESASASFGGCKAIAVFSGPLVDQLAEQQRLVKILNAVRASALLQALQVAVIVEGEPADLALAHQIVAGLLPKGEDARSFGASAYHISKSSDALSRFMDYMPGPAWRDVPIDPPDSVDHEDAILIQRAFSDCD